MKTIIRLGALSCAVIVSTAAMAAENTLDRFEFNGAANTVPSGWQMDGGGNRFDFGRGTIESAGKLNGGGALNVELRTYDAQAPSRFYEQGMRTNKLYFPKAGNYISVRARIKINHNQPGIVHGLFFFKKWQTSPYARQDEIDFEWLSNETSKANPDNVNVSAWKGWNAKAGYNSGNNTDYGKQTSLTVNSKVAVDGYHQYEMKWYRNKIDFYIDNVLIKQITDTNLIPTHSMPVFLNSWAPGNDWPDAYNSSLKTTGASGNRTYQMQVDWLTVTEAT